LAGSRQQIRDRALSHEPPTASSALRRARLATAVAFFLTGAIVATWAARVPAIKANLDLSNAQIAIGLMGWNAGAIVGLQLGGVVVARSGGRSALRWSVPVFSVALAATALAPSFIWLALAMVVAGVVNSVIDVGMNAHGVRVEQLRDDRILSGLHGMLPLGGMAAGSLAALAAWQDIGVGWHFGLVAAAAAVAGVFATGWMLPAATEREPASPSRAGSGNAVSDWFRGWSKPIIAFGGLAFCVTLAEAGMGDWAAVFLSDSRNASASLAATGVAAFLTGMTLGRFAGDQLIERFGPPRMFRAGGGVATAGFVLAVMIDQPLVGVIGIALIGAGISYLLPLLFSVANGMSTERTPAEVVARISTIAYVGSFAGSGLIGMVASLASLEVALIIPAVLVAAAALASLRIALES
jgi:fucose permease